LRFGLLSLVFLVPAAFAAPQALERTQPAVKVDVNLVMVNAAVTDPNGRSVTGLDKSLFQIWEDRIQQQIQYFSATEVPLSVAVVFDVSSSMADKLPVSRDAVAKLLKIGNPQDEYALIEFNSRPRVTRDFAAGFSSFQNELASTSAAGSTALYDAVYLGIEKLRDSHNHRKALLLVTDGEDNHSRYSFSDIKELAMESEVQLFAIRIGGYTSPTATKGHKPGSVVLKELVDLTGGEVFFASDVQRLDAICANISETLRNEYVIGYAPSNTARDGKWRGLKLKVNATSHVSIHARSGYYAPTQ
jgi:Ca-activated chloride channel family protein